MTQISFLPSEQFNVHLYEQTHFKPFPVSRFCGYFALARGKEKIAVGEQQKPCR